MRFIEKKIDFWLHQKLNLHAPLHSTGGMPRQYKLSNLVLYLYASGPEKISEASQYGILWSLLSLLCVRVRLEVPK